MGHGKDHAHCPQIQRSCQTVLSISRVGWILFIYESSTTKHFPLRFIVDPTSPEYQSGDEDECVDEDGEVEVYDYEILSKSTSPARP